MTAEVVVQPDTYQAQACGNPWIIPDEYQDVSEPFGTRQEAVDWATARVQAAIDDPEYTAYDYPSYSIGVQLGIIVASPTGPPRPPDNLETT